ncbi:MAG: hypothetical protein M9949_14120 [Candidatus Kapabacteria bacterium]|nr:hypothetical protein [Candidatus Kapabacteria bacterium]
MLTEMVRGATEKIRFNYSLNSVPQSLTGTTIVHTWKKSPKDPEPALRISKTDHDNEYETLVVITPAMTKNLELTTYYWEFVIIKSDGTRISRKKGLQGHLELTFNLEPIPG